MSEVVTKSALADALYSAEIGLTQDRAKQAVDIVIGGIAHGLKTGRKVTLNGFATFDVKATKPRVGRNPATGEQVSIPAGRKITFKPSGILKESI